MSKSTSLPLLATDAEVGLRMDACLQYTFILIFSLYFPHWNTNALHRRLRSEINITLFV